MRQAAHEFGWHDLAVAGALTVFFQVFGDGGGILLAQVTDAPNPILDPAKTYGKTLLTALTRSLPFVFCIRVADLAIADGARPWRAYVSALLAALVATVLIIFARIDPMTGAEFIRRTPWVILRFGTHFGTAVVIYALWRSSQRATERVRASETTRARDLQRLQSAELLALQARVDPQLLFDALGRVGTLQRHDPAAADALLTNLIALLRAMLPSAAATGSTVAREFAVVEAWLRVARELAAQPPSVALTVGAAAQGSALAPMLALPLLRGVLDADGAARIGWQLGAEAAGARLLVTLAADPWATNAPVPERLALDPLRERLALLHGDAAQLRVIAVPLRLVLDLPLAIEPASQPGTRLGRAQAFA